MKIFSFRDLLSCGLRPKKRSHRLLSLVSSLGFPFFLLMIAGSLAAQEVAPSPSPATVKADSGHNEHKEVPLPQESGQQKPEPELLPEVNAIPNTLPATGGATLPRKPRVLTAEEQKRFEEIRQKAMQSPRALEMLAKAKACMTSEAKRIYMDAYIVMVCVKMREIEPDFAEPIRSYQRRESRRIFRR